MDVRFRVFPLVSCIETRLALAALILIVVLAFFFLRHRRHKLHKKQFDGNFDPAITDKRSSMLNFAPTGPSDSEGGTLPVIPPEIIAELDNNPFVSAAAPPPNLITSESGSSLDAQGRYVGGTSPTWRYSMQQPYDENPPPITPMTTGSSSSAYSQNPHHNNVMSPQYSYPPPIPAQIFRRRSATSSPASSPASSLPPPSSYSRPQSQGSNSPNPSRPISPTSEISREQRERYIQTGPQRSPMITEPVYE